MSKFENLYFLCFPEIFPLLILVPNYLSNKIICELSFVHSLSIYPFMFLSAFYIYIYIYIYIILYISVTLMWLPLLIKINVRTDEGNSRNWMWHWINEIGVAVQTWLWVLGELIAQNGIQWSWVQISLRSTFYSYFKKLKYN